MHFRIKFLDKNVQNKKSNRSNQFDGQKKIFLTI